MMKSVWTDVSISFECAGREEMLLPYDSFRADHFSFHHQAVQGLAQIAIEIVKYKGSHCHTLRNALLRRVLR